LYLQVNGMQYDIKKIYKLFLIHFVNAKNNPNGFGRELGHGVGFFTNNTEDIKFAKNILFIYDKYKCTCPLTLELI